MSKRAGNFVTLRDVVDQVGPGVTRFHMLTRKNDAPLDFDFAKVLEQSRENPVFYVQYAHARVCSGVAQGARGGIDVDDATLAAADLGGLGHEAELALARKLAEWPRLVEVAARTGEPHRVAFYLYDLASDFHSLWNLGHDEPACACCRRATKPQVKPKSRSRGPRDRCHFLQVLVFSASRRWKRCADNNRARRRPRGRAGRRRCMHRGRKAKMAEMAEMEARGTPGRPKAGAPRQAWANWVNWIGAAVSVALLVGIGSTGATDAGARRAAAFRWCGGRRADARATRGPGRQTGRQHGAGGEQVAAKGAAEATRRPAGAGAAAAGPDRRGSARGALDRAAQSDATRLPAAWKPWSRN